MSTRPVGVTGGAASIAADCQDMIAVSSLIGTVAENLGLQAVLLQRELADGLNASSLIDPDGAARVEVALVTALDGPRGLVSVAVRTVTMQLALRAAAEAYLLADQLRTDLIPIVSVVENSTRSEVDAVSDLLAGRYSKALQDPLTENPYLIDLVVDGLAGPLGVQARMAELGAVYDDGHAVLKATGVDRSVAAAMPPRSLADLVGDLARRNDTANGEISVQILTGTDENGKSYRKVVVDIPGTKDWTPYDPVDTGVTNLGTNYRALAGERTSYEDGVIAALKAAGVTADDDVTLIGHSLGGVVAVNTARDLVASGQNVTHVITAGAPISDVVKALPSSVQVLALENSGDLVPHVDGSANPDLGNVTTVTLDHDHRSADQNHSLDKSYLPGAADVDASNDPSVRAYLNGLQGQLTATTGTTYTYVVSRGF
jgi:hypothetical protein